MIRKLLFILLALIITVFLFLLMRYLITPVGEPSKEEPKDTNTETPEISEIKSLKIIVRPLNDNDIKERKLPNQTTGLVITNIGKNSPVDYLNIGDIIVEAQKKKIKSTKNLEDIVDTVLKSNQKTILIVIYNNQNQESLLDGIYINNQIYFFLIKSMSFGLKSVTFIDLTCTSSSYILWV